MRNDMHVCASVLVLPVASSWPGGSEASDAGDGGGRERTGEAGPGAAGQESQNQVRRQTVSRVVC